jgi:hypothetical protein
MMPAALRRLPPVVSTFLIFTVITFAVGLARSPKLWHHPIAGVIVVALIALWIAAIVVWRQRWAWALWVLLVLSAPTLPSVGGMERSAGVPVQSRHARAACVTWNAAVGWCQSAA